MTRSTGRIILGLIWFIDGILELLPGTASNFPSLFTGMAQGQPTPIHSLILWGHSVILPYPIAWNDALAAAELAVGVALIIGLWPRLTLLASIALSIPIWIWGQAFGGFLTGDATDIGAMPLYVLAACLAWPPGEGGEWSWLRGHRSAEPPPRESGRPAQAASILSPSSNRRRALTSVSIIVLSLLTLNACQGRRSAADTGDAKISVAVSPSPPAVGPSQLTFTVTDATGTPISGAKLRVEGDMTHAGMHPVDATLRDSGQGRYISQGFHFTMGGDWVVTLSGTLPNGSPLRQTISLPGVGSGGSNG